MTGEVGILNVGAGDNKLVFDPNDAAGMIRAARIVNDMIRRGYALLVEIGKDDEGRPRYRRAQAFDESSFEYIIADFDPALDQPQDQRETQYGQDADTPAARGESGGQGSKRGNARGRKARIPASTASAVAVGRTAGG